MEKESSQSAEIIEVSQKEIGEGFAGLRLVDPRLNALMVRSLHQYGQLSPVVVGPKENGVYEMVDGFKRLHACRELGYDHLKARLLHAGRRGLKAAVIHLNWTHRSIGYLEEAMVLHSLYREDCLTQQEIGILLGRHKSWVSRRISLIERLCDEVIGHIRLGLLSASVARELARLPRGNQESAMHTILKYRFNYREVERLVGLLLTCPRWDHEAILRFPQEILEDRRPPQPKKIKPTEIVTAIMETLMAMKKQALSLLEKLGVEVLTPLTEDQRLEVLSAIEDVERTFKEIKNLLVDQDHGSALC